MQNMSKPSIYTQEIDLGDGKKITLETGRLANQANGSVTLTLGNAMILATAVSSNDSRDLPFLPLTVDYIEKFSAVGRFPGGFIKREAKPSENEVMISRLVDRAVRPLFPDYYRNDTQIMLTLMSADKNVPPDALAGLAASAALSLSDIPFAGPFAEVRVARIDGELVLNPYLNELEKADLDMIIAGTEDNVTMVEGEMHELSEDEMLEAIKKAHEAIKEQCRAQHELMQKAGNDTAPKERIAQEDKEVEDPDFQQKCLNYFREGVKNIARQHLGKKERHQKFRELKEQFWEELPEEEQTDEYKELMKGYFGEVEEEVIRNMILEEGERIDGRKTDEIRDIWSQVDYLPSAHGSAIFTRGETQALAALTIGSKSDEQMVDNVMEQGYSKFMLHYNFPPFSTGEAKPLRPPARREIGHGNLALRAVNKILPPDEENPYTIRIVVDILESNGSSSMATVCSSSLALMDAGIHVKKPVAGIAMGLVTGEESGKYAVLSDILGDEDHVGDMDFKVAGTRDGITACQMDIKTTGIDYEVMAKALEQARNSRLEILDEMDETISEYRPEFKKHAPRIERFKFDKELIGTVIGPGGRQIQAIQEETNTSVTVDEEDGRGMVEISSTDGSGDVDKAIRWVQNLVEQPEPGKVYQGKVKAIMPFGAFVEYLPGKDGLLHISEISWEHIPDMEGVLEVGQEIEVKLIEIDEKTGKAKLSRKELLSKPDKMKNKE